MSAENEHRIEQKLDLVGALRDKQAWFDGKHFIESPDAPPYVPCKELLGPAADAIERLQEIEKRAIEVGAGEFDWQRKSSYEEWAHFSDMHYVLTGERII